jgi:zinc protease
MDSFSAVLVTDRAAELRDTLLSGKPTPITYDTKGTPDAVLAEDKLIEKEPLPIRPEAVRVVPVETLFEK